MSIVIIERDGRLAETQEATLRLNFNRSNRMWWDDTHRIPLAVWPARRDGEIDGILSRLDWRDIRDVPEGRRVAVASGIGTTFAIRRGRTVTFIRRSGSGREYPFETPDGRRLVWRIGRPLPEQVGWTVERLRAEWDSLAQASRLRKLDRALGGDYRHTWIPLARAIADAILGAAGAGDWGAAGRIVEAAYGERWDEIAGIVAPFAATAGDEDWWQARSSVFSAEMYLGDLLAPAPAS